MTKRFLTLLVIFVLLAVGVGSAFAFRIKLKQVFQDITKQELPVAKPFAPKLTDIKDVEKDPVKVDIVQALGEVREKPVFIQENIKNDVVTEDVPDQEPTADEIVATEDAAPLSTNLAIPFTPQAPHANWDLPYQEACEEASLIMVNAWMVGMQSGLISPNEADQQILKLVAWQKERFGYYEDTNAEETAIIAREYFGYKNTKVLPVNSIDDIRSELAKGFAVILPASGRELLNPYFSGLGPLYHMLVAKGYTEDGRIITNDPGTRRGGDFLYDPNVLFEALGDWNDGDPANGEKLMIILVL